jgi:hypothetical protein
LNVKDALDFFKQNFDITDLDYVVFDREFGFNIEARGKMIGDQYL